MQPDQERTERSRVGWGQEDSRPRYEAVNQMFSIVQNKETNFHETCLNHFKENKVEIASAITKPFPFLESLRDRSFITEKLYNDSQEAYRNLVPLGKVVYHILCHLEKTFDRSLLQAIFSRTHLKEYPNLIQVHRSFENVIQEKYLSQESDREETRILPNTQPSRERGAEQSENENLERSGAVILVDVHETISPCRPKMDQEVQQARPACAQAPEMIVISSESSAEGVPLEA
ncbi:nuclear body protein SP140-like protein isoform X2 [Rhinolophus sinicus]|uniref:nuclear body protein SP140-like protein isoform X2 n=1 Tax=Rhinolophus sinicus TaxID=89399 RepID=UPI003D78B666